MQHTKDEVIAYSGLFVDLSGFHAAASVVGMSEQLRMELKELLDAGLAAPLIRFQAGELDDGLRLLTLPGKAQIDVLRDGVNAVEVVMKVSDVVNAAAEMGEAITQPAVADFLARWGNKLALDHTGLIVYKQITVHTPAIAEPPIDMLSADLFGETAAG